MNKLMVTTWYKLKMMLQNRLFIAAMIILPVFIASVMSSVLKDNKQKEISLIIIDEDKSTYSKFVVDKLCQKSGLDVHLEDNRNDALDIVKNNKAEALFVINRGFETAIRQGENRNLIDMVKAPASYSSDFLKEVIAAEVMRLRAGNMALLDVLDTYGASSVSYDSDFSDEVMGYYDRQWEQNSFLTLLYREISSDPDGNSTEEKITGNIAIPVNTSAISGILLVFIMFYILFNCSWIIEEKNNGTLKRIASCNGALLYSYLGNISALVISVAAIISIISLISRFLFKVSLFLNPFILLILLSYTVTVIAAGMFLSSVLKTPVQLQSFTPAFTLITSFAGGCFWSFTAMPDTLRKVSLFTPQGWALKSIYKLIEGSYSTEDVLLPVLILLSVSLVLFTTSYILIKKRLENLDSF